MTNAVLTSLAPSTGLGYEDGFRRGLAWASEAPVSELSELVECTRGRNWSEIAVRGDWSSLRVELAPHVLDRGTDDIVRRDPFVVGFVESASFLFWDPESVDDGFAD